MDTSMPRIARLDTPGLLHHVMIRGIERRKIFKTIRIVKTSLNGYLFSCLKPRPNATPGHFYRIMPIFC